MQEKPEKTKLNSFLIAVIFLFLGITLFVISVFSNMQIISLIGLGLTFWGVLFLLIPPPKYVEGSFLITSALPNYLTIDRILNDLKPKNEAYNIPPCPRDVVLPEHLEGLKEVVTFIPAEQTLGMAEIEDIARGKFLIEKPKGVLISSPGIDLLNKMEQKRNIDFAKIPLNELDETLPYSLNELYLAKEIEITTNENEIILQVHDSLYNALYCQKYNLKSITLLGCPLVNAAACAIAKSAGKPTLIQEIRTTPNGKTTIVTFKIANWKFEKQLRLIEDDQKVSLRRNELLEVIHGSISIVDLMFDVLINLRKKRIIWQQIDAYSKNLGETFSFLGQSMPLLTINFSEFLSAIKSQNPKKTSKESNRILKMVYDYFDRLNIEDDITGSFPNFLNSKVIILSYYTLNDLLLGKAVGEGEKENKKEVNQLEGVLLILANNTEFKVNIEALKAQLDKVIPENDFEKFVEDSRAIFKEQLIVISSLYSGSMKKN